MASHARTPSIIVALVAVSAVMLSVPALAAASSLPTTSLPPQAAWAYGAEWSGHESGLWSNGTYSATAFFGWEAILTQVNTSSTTFQVHVQWAAAADLWVSYCSPSCSSPTTTANLTDRTFEAVSATTNFTDAATVTTASGPGPAWGISGAWSSFSANLSESAVVHSPHVDASRTLSVHGTANASVAFTPALGLVPLNVSSAPKWNASSDYMGAGAWSLSYRFTKAPLGGGPSTEISGNPNGSFAGPGTLAVNGSVVGATTLNDGFSTSAVDLVLSGPFTLVDGAVLVPTMIELFHHEATSTPAQSPWAGSRIGNQTATLASLDYRTTGVPHFGLLASAMSYSSTDTNPSVTDAMSSDSSTFFAANAGPADVIQGQPQSVAAAESGDACLETGVGCGPTTSGGLTPELRTLIAVGVVVALGAIVGALVVERRRRVPPPPHPNAALYPPGAARNPTSPSGSAAAPEKPRGEPPPPSDPLDHLW